MSRATDGNAVRSGTFAAGCLGRSAPLNRRVRGAESAGAAPYAARAAALSPGPAPSKRDRLRYADGETSW